MAIGLIGALMLGGAGLNATAALRSSLAEKEALTRQAATSARNVRLADERIDQARDIGREAEAATLRGIRSSTGTQKAGLAKGAIDLGFGTPLDILNDTQEVGEFDLDIIKRNTANKIFDLEIIKANAQDETNLLSSAASDVDPGFAFASTLLSGFTGFAANQQQQKNLASVQLAFITQADPLYVLGDAEQILRMASNLISNAMQYTPNGEVRVSTFLDTQQERVCLQVEDTGIGIAPEDSPYLFDKFYRGKSVSQSNVPGIGLGLTIVKRVVDLHEGHITVQSQPGKGSRFLVCLPSHMA